MANTVLQIYEIQNIGKGVIYSITPDNLLLLTPTPITPGIQTVLNVQEHINSISKIIIDPLGSFFTHNLDGFGGYLSISPDTGIGAPLPTSSIGICDAFGFTTASLEFYHDKTLFKDNVSLKGIEYAASYESNFTARSLITKQYVDDAVNIIPVSATQSGIVNNTALQELGGADKLINGIRAGKGNSTGIDNTVFGENSQYNATTGNENTSFGFEALRDITTGSYNSAFGWGALQLNNATANTAIGDYALGVDVFGTQNVAIGANALSSNIGTSGSNIFGHRCVAIGTSAMLSNTTGNGIGIGSFALSNQTTGMYNIGLGFQAGSGITTGGANIVIAGTGFIAPGGGITTGSNNLIIAQNNGNTTGLTTGSGNTIIGKVTGLSASLSNTVILSDGVGTQRLISSSTNLTTLPAQTIALITGDGTGKAIVNKEYFDANALHTTGNESFTGIKSSTNTGAAQINGISLTNNGTFGSTSLLIGNASTGSGIALTNYSSGKGMELTLTGGSSGQGIGISNAGTGDGINISNFGAGTGLFIGNSGTGADEGLLLSNSSTNSGSKAIYSASTSAGISIYSSISGSGSSIVSNVGTAGTGFAFIGQDNGVNTFTVSKTGAIVASDNFLTSGTNKQIMVASGGSGVRLGAASNNDAFLTGSVAGDGVVLAHQKLFLAVGAGSIPMAYTVEGNLGVGVINPGAKVDIFPSSTTAASIRIRQGVAPSLPNDGDMWLEDNSLTGLKIRINGVTRTVNLT